MDPLLLTVEQAAQALAQSRSTVYELMGAGELASVKLGRARRIPRAALEAYVAGLTTVLNTSATMEAA